MDKISEIYDLLKTEYGFYGLLLMLSLLILLAVQLRYWLGTYARVSKHKVGRTSAGARDGGISVVVLTGENFPYIENTLPKLVAQNYDRFEIIVVEIGTTEEFSDELAALKGRLPNLVTTKIEPDPRFPISNKMAYNVGIKAARYENILLTTSDAEPVSDKWLACMGKGFAAGEIVLGYCGMEKKRSMAAKIMRSSRLMMSVRYLSAAIGKKCYRGIIHNIGFSRELYFSNRGFDHLDMNIGEDDLFIQRISKGRSVSVVMNPHATMRETSWGGLGWWWKQRKFYGSAYRLYPRAVKNRIECELGSRLLFLLATVVCIIILPIEIKIGAAALWLLRLFLVRHQLWRIRRRLGENGIGLASVIYDTVEPFTAIALAFSRRVRPMAGVRR